MSAATTSGEDRKVPGEGTSLTAERWASSKTESTERLKGAGMHGERAHVNPMVALRTVAYVDRWAKAWPHITVQQRQQARAVSADRRVARAQVAQAQASLLETPTVAVSVATLPAAKVPSCRAAVTSGDRTHRPHKPAADHPWRRGSLNRPRCA